MKRRLRLERKGWERSGRNDAKGKGSNKRRRNRFARLRRVDIAAKGKECVLLLTAGSLTTAASSRKWPVLAWYPDEKLVGVVSNTLMPPRFVPLACSPKGLLCGMRGFFGDSGYDCVLSLAVYNPSTGFQRRLPVLTLDQGMMAAENAHRQGLTKIRVAGDESQFRVHVLRTQVGGGHSIHSFDSGSGAWTLAASTSRDMPPTLGGVAGEFLFWDGGLKAYDAAAGAWSGAEFPHRQGLRMFPVPHELAGYTYIRAFPLARGTRTLLAALCLSPGEDPAPGLALLERDELHPQELVLKAVSGLALKKDTSRCLFFSLPWLVPGEKLAVFSDDLFAWPVALDLERHAWTEFPAEYRDLPTAFRHGSIAPTCVYTPPMQN